MTSRTINVLIAALGGEGGGVLADWIISAATHHDFPVQSTSVPGVAQRTGATTYYIEIFPVPRSELAGRSPVLALTPTPGRVDLAVASELLEVGRVIQGGFVDPSRTVLVGSTHREFVSSEKLAMADGRHDSAKLIAAAKSMARRWTIADMRALAWKHGTVINTVMLGAMAASGVLPFPRETFERAIRKSGKAVDSSLKGFAAGFGLASGTPPDALRFGERPKTAAALPDALSSLPQEAQEIVRAGMRQVRDYQDQAYVDLYLERVQSVFDLERALGGEYPVTREAARYLALWMTYEDLIRVADLKTRAIRLDRVRAEVSAKPGEPVRITEFLKPGLDELCSVLPPMLSRRLFAALESRRHRLNVGLHVRTDTVFGFATLCALRSLRPLRRWTSRYGQEQAFIGRWLDAVKSSLSSLPQLAYEVALCGNLVKGYGDTSARGHRNLAVILDELSVPLAREELVSRIAGARKAALDEPEGRALAAALGQSAPELVAKPLRFIRRPASIAQRTPRA